MELLEKQIEEISDILKKINKQLKKTPQYDEYNKARHSLFQSTEYKNYTKARDNFNELDIYKEKMKKLKEKRKMISVYLMKREEEEY